MTSKINNRAKYKAIVVKAIAVKAIVVKATVVKATYYKYKNKSPSRNIHFVHKLTVKCHSARRDIFITN